MGQGVSPFMLPKPDLLELEEMLSQTFPELDLSPVRSGEESNQLAIVNTANRPWAIIESAFLNEHLSDCKIEEFYFSPSGRRFLSDKSRLDESVVSVSDLQLLLDKVSEFKASTVYLRVSPHTKSEYLISIFRIKFPDISLIVEPYDLSCLFEPELLGYTDLNDTHYVQAMLGCAVALHHSEALVVKMGGYRFAQLEKPYPEKLISFLPTSAYEFNNIPTSDEFNERVGSFRKVLYAGSASARELNGGIGSVDGANLTRYFDAVVKSRELDLSIVNGAHTSSDEDHSSKFKKLLQRYAFPDEKTKNCTYFRAMTQQQLAALAINFDLGICCAHYAKDKVVEVTKVSIPNRMTSYVQAGLPVVIDDRFEYAGSLIETFGAGAVIPAGDFDSFVDSLANINIQKAKTGVMHLRRFFQDENNKNLAFLLLAFR